MSDYGLSLSPTMIKLPKRGVCVMLEMLDVPWFVSL